MSDTELRRAEIAYALLENELFKEVTEKLKTELLKDWIHSEIQDEEDREMIFRYCRVIDKYVDHIQSIANTGKLVKFARETNRR